MPQMFWRIVTFSHQVKLVVFHTIVFMWDLLGSLAEKYEHMEILQWDKCVVMFLLLVLMGTCFYCLDNCFPCCFFYLQVSIACPERMEPITKVSHIPPSRWALVCSLCKLKTGACIQVHTCSVVTLCGVFMWERQFRFCILFFLRSEVHYNADDHWVDAYFFIAVHSHISSQAQRFRS